MVIFKVELNDKGDLISLNLLNSSGNTEFDGGVEQAIRVSMPFYEITGLPAKERQMFHNITYKFQPAVIAN